MNEYIEIAKVDISESRSIVVSSYPKSGGYTIAQQIKAQEGDKTTTVFMKGAFHIDSISGLYNVRDLLNLVIDKIENEVIADNIEWDE